MSIPDDFKTELLDRVSLAQVVGTTLNWDQRKSQPAKGDYWACCPFHGEKTPSFHVDDRKGYYYCFGCHEKGNAISYLRQTRNMGFREAIESLAGMVGMRVPEPTRQDREKADRASVLQMVCEEASSFFQKSLRSNLGAPTRSYLAERGVSEKTQRRFRIGYAPAGGELIVHLAERRISQQQMLDAGLVAKSERNDDVYCRFRDRLMFPISNTGGRTIAFGGRAMGSGVPAKYLNSPETDLFSKGSCLYNHGPARDACRGRDPLLVVEGYMDVVALQQVGIESCVAPLGTAVTETQLRHIWRMAPKPVLALDGDVAGLRAAERTARLALPLLSPGKTLEFCIMPEGEDPDDVVRRQGKEGMLELVGKAIPLAEFLWQRETRNRDLSRPENRAEFEESLLRSVRTIRDQTVRKYYVEHFESRLGGRTVKGPQGGWTGNSRTRRQRREVIAPTPELQRSRLARSDLDPRTLQELRETFVLGICLSVPGVVIECLEKLEGLELHCGENSRILYSITNNNGIAAEAGDRFRNAVERDVGEELVRNVLESKQVVNCPVVKDVRMGHRDRLESARAAISEEIRKLETASGATAEISTARDTIARDEEDNPTARVASAVTDRERAKRGLDARETGEFVLLDNGVRISADDLQEFEAACDGTAANPPG